jgi:hypothetical protein
MGPPSNGAAAIETSAPLYPIAPHPHHRQHHLPPPPPPPQHHVPLARASEPWLAAQNLAFMKHGSPDKKRKDLGDMPSLASSSEGTSPGDAVVPRSRLDDDAILLAAVAMTEFGQSSPIGKRSQSMAHILKRVKLEATPTAYDATTAAFESPSSNSKEKSVKGRNTNT